MQSARPCVPRQRGYESQSGLPFRTSSATPRFLQKKRACCSIAPSRRSRRRLSFSGSEAIKSASECASDAEFVYSGSFWEAGLPNPGNQEFVAAYQKEFNRAPAVQSANAYAGCQLFVEAVRRAGNLDSDKLHEVLLALKTKTVLGDFAVDERGFQVGHKAITIQWQDGKQVVVWPDELASGKPRFPTPPWSERLTSK